MDLGLGGLVVGGLICVEVDGFEDGQGRVEKWLSGW